MDDFEAIAADGWNMVAQTDDGRRFWYRLDGEHILARITCDGADDLRWTMKPDPTTPLGVLILDGPPLDGGERAN